MNVFAKSDEILSMIPQEIKETKLYGHTFGWTDGRSDVKTVYPQDNVLLPSGWWQYSQGPVVQRFLGQLKQLPSICSFFVEKN